MANIKRLPAKGIWVERHEVVGTSGKPYIVSLKNDGTFGCSCPTWIFSKVRPKPDCQHILQLKFEQKTAAAGVQYSYNQFQKKEAKPEEATRSIRYRD